MLLPGRDVTRIQQSFLVAADLANAPADLAESVAEAVAEAAVSVADPAADPPDPTDAGRAAAINMKTRWSTRPDTSALTAEIVDRIWRHQEFGASAPSASTCTCWKTICTSGSLTLPR